jgi:hypothetical protein
MLVEVALGKMAFAKLSQLALPVSSAQQLGKVGRKRGRMSPPFLQAPFRTGQDTFASSGSPVAILYGAGSFRLFASRVPPVPEATCYPSPVGLSARVDGFPVLRRLRQLRDHRVRTP